MLKNFSSVNHSKGSNICGMKESIYYHIIIFVFLKLYFGRLINRG